MNIAEIFETDIYIIPEKTLSVFNFFPVKWTIASKKASFPIPEGQIFKKKSDGLRELQKDWVFLRSPKSKKIENLCDNPISLKWTTSGDLGGGVNNANIFLVTKRPKLHVLACNIMEDSSKAAPLHPGVALTTNLNS